MPKWYAEYAGILLYILTGLEYQPTYVRCLFACYYSETEVSFQFRAIALIVLLLYGTLLFCFSALFVVLTFRPLSIAGKWCSHRSQSRFKSSPVKTRVNHTLGDVW